jgi:hypothetical protein
MGRADPVRSDGEYAPPRERQASRAACTSCDAYAEAVLKGRTASQRQRILECVRASAVPLTRRRISKSTGISINAVCPAVLSLLGAGLLRKAYEDVDQGSQSKAQFLEPVTPAPVQRKFVWPEPSRG